MQLENLFIIFLSLLTIILLLGSLGLLAANTTWSSTTKWRAKSEINVLLGIQTNDEGWDIDDLLADSDVALTDQDTSVVNGFGESEFVDTGLETTLKEIFDFEGQDVIKLHARLIEDTDTDETTNQGVTFEETLGVLFVESEKLTD